MTILSALLRITLLTATSIGLVACGGSGTSTKDVVVDQPLPPVPTPQDQFDMRFGESEALIALLFGSQESPSGLSGTQFAQIPDSGTAHFEGVGVIATSASNAKLSRAAYLLGDAHIKVDFNDQALSGEVTDFVVLTGIATDLAARNDTSGAVAGTGTLTVTGGRLATDRPNQYSDIFYSGVVTTDASTYQFAGFAAGNFYGTRPDAPAGTRIKAIDIYDGNGSAIVDGEQWSSEVFIGGETN